MFQVGKQLFSINGMGEGVYKEFRLVYRFGTDFVILLYLAESLLKGWLRFSDYAVFVKSQGISISTREPRTRRKQRSSQAHPFALTPSDWVPLKIPPVPIFSCL